MSSDIESARRMLVRLEYGLRPIVEKDSEQEVRGIAIPVLDEALGMVREALGDNPVVNAVGGVISVETIGADEPLRAVDVLLVVNMFLGALPPPPRTVTADGLRLDPSF